MQGRNAEWKIPLLGGGEDKGLNDGGLQNFKSRLSVSREPCQNIIDANDLESTGIPTAEFSLSNVPVSELPGLEKFSAMFDACKHYDDGGGSSTSDTTADFFRVGQDILNDDAIPVLRIRDTNTTGLSGDDQDRSSRWYRLVRGQGRACVEGAGGGTFGIGQRAPFAFSQLRLVFYSSLVGNQHRFMGKYLLCTCRDPETERSLQNIGYYGIPHDDEDVLIESITDPEQIPGSFRRQEQGTDIYVIGFSLADWKNSILSSVLIHFYASIDNEQLRVIVKDESSRITVGKENLVDLIEEQIEIATGDEKDRLKRSLYSVRALREGILFKKHIDRLGEVSLFIYQHELARDKISYMRKPRMLVWDRGSQIIKNFQAVVLVDSDEGNDYLKDLEDPKHETWDPGQPDGWSDEQIEDANKTLRDVREFVNTTLRDIRGETDNSVEDIPELARWLPAEDDEEDWSTTGGLATDESGPDESARETGASGPATIIPVRRRRTPQTVAGTEESTVGDDEGTTGPGDGSGSGDGPGHSIGEHGGDTAGGIQITDSRVRFRSWHQRGEPENRYRLALTPNETFTGDLTLVAVGAAGQYTVAAVAAENAGSGEQIECRSGSLVGINLTEGQVQQIDVDLDVEVSVSLAIGGNA